jgi:predicted transport protein
VEIDGKTITQQDYNYIQQLNDIVKETNETGTFQIGNLKITINSLEEQQHKYIRL